MMETVERPLLSIVTGTYNRLSSLQLFIASCRAQLLKGITYEFIIVDGGSTDGTLEWLADQPDIVLLAQGKLLGAITAFTDGADLAQGEYVAMMNDDVIVRDLTFLAAIGYLETHPSCGAVAIADTRRSQITGENPPIFRTEGMGATLADGTQTMVTYAQCGVFRRELGAEAGWWGRDDPIMSKGRQYGADNFLSARIWEMGYTVDPVPLCMIDDLIIVDDLRKSYTADGGVFYERFPTIYIPEVPSVFPMQERMRVVYLPVYEGGHAQDVNLDPWLSEAFWDLDVMCVEGDYLNTDIDIRGICAAWQPDLLLLQVQNPGAITPGMLADIRILSPETVIVNWNGDAYEEGLTSAPVLDILRHVDLQLVTNTKVLPRYESEGIPAAFWQIAFKEALNPAPEMPSHDILFQGNWYQYRADFFDLLYSLPYDVGVYGNDSRSQGNTHYDFAAQGSLYANARITIGTTYPGTEGHVSNRLVQAMGHGAFLLHQQSKGIEQLMGLKDNKHLVFWSDLEDLRVKIDYWMSGERADERAKIAAAGKALIRSQFTCEAQLQKLLTVLLPEVLRARHVVA